MIQSFKNMGAKLPQGYEEQIGTGVKSFGLDMYFEAGASEQKIMGFLHRVGLKISKGKFSNLLIKDQDVCHNESGALYESGLRSSSYNQSDSTLTPFHLWQI